jgi:hypothetical protein
MNEAAAARVVALRRSEGIERLLVAAGPCIHPVRFDPESVPVNSRSGRHPIVMPLARLSYYLTYRGALVGSVLVLTTLDGAPSSPVVCDESATE